VPFVLPFVPFVVPFVPFVVPFVPFVPFVQFVQFSTAEMYLLLPWICHFPHQIWFLRYASEHVTESPIYKKCIVGEKAPTQ
jgi:hypothetical protein